jgi:hypothetical protein
MGKGNWRPRTDHTQDGSFADQVYLDVVGLELFEDNDEDVLAMLRDVLGHCFRRSALRPVWKHSLREDHVLMESKRALVVLESGFELHHVGIGVVTNPDVFLYGGALDEHLAERTAAMNFNKLKRELLKTFPGRVSIRTSAWTSALLESA